jgi:hypothetical protein
MLESEAAAALSFLAASLFCFFLCHLLARCFDVRLSLAGPVHATLAAETAAFLAAAFSFRHKSLPLS